MLKNPLDMIGVKTDPVLSNPKDLISIKTDPVLRQIDALSLNFDSLMTLIGTLERAGVKLDYRMVQIEGLTTLEVSLDGKSTQSFVVECEHCSKIEFEY